MPRVGLEETPKQKINKGMMQMLTTEIEASNAMSDTSSPSLAVLSRMQTIDFVQTESGLLIPNPRSNDA